MCHELRRTTKCQVKKSKKARQKSKERSIRNNTARQGCEQTNLTRKAALPSDLSLSRTLHNGLTSRLRTILSFHIRSACITESNDRCLCTAYVQAFPREDSYSVLHWKVGWLEGMAFYRLNRTRGDSRSYYSKHRLTPHLTSYTPPYTFTPFLNLPKISTPQNIKTRSTPQLTIKQIEQPTTQSTYQHNTKSQYTNKIKTTSVPHTSTLPNPKHKHLPTQPQTPKHKTKSKQPPPHLTSYTPPYAFTPFLNPPNTSTLTSRKTQSTSQQSIQQSRNKAAYQSRSLARRLPTRPIQSSKTRRKTQST